MNLTTETPAQLERERVYQNYNGVMEHLKLIPHLKLSMKIDISSLQKEAALVDEWIPHELDPARFPSEYIEKHRRHFQGRSLVDYKKDSRIISDTGLELEELEGAEISADGSQIFHLTDLGEKMPYTIQLLKSFGPWSNRVRIMRIPPGGYLEWHSHHQGPYFSKQRYSLATFNIPLYTNPDVIHQVRSPKNRNEIFDCNYQAGHCYLLNSWQEHRIVNRGNTDRIAIVPYFHFFNETLLENIKKDVESYQGPLFASAEKG